MGKISCSTGDFSLDFISRVWENKNRFGSWGDSQIFSLQVLKATGYPSHDLRSQHETAIIGDPQDSYWLVATWILFFHILGKIIQSDFHIFQRGRSTTNQVKVRSNSKSSRCLMFYFSAFSGDRSSVFFSPSLFSRGIHQISESRDGGTNQSWTFTTGFGSSFLRPQSRHHDINSCFISCGENIYI
jgi:hypothetical protein